MRMPNYLVGVDVGGTFTDVLAYDPDSAVLASAKVPSLPGEQWRGVLDALAALGIKMTDIRAFVHGTTIATNALLERKGAPTGLVTTAGFRDVLEIGKGRRLIGGLFDAAWLRPAPIVPRGLRLEVQERTRADGTIERDLDSCDLERIADTFRVAGVRSVAVAFLNSYVNDAHERQAATALSQFMPGIPVSQSAELARERGEFERTSTCVLNAYLTPLMVEYLATLEAELRTRGVSAGVNIMGSNGGAMTLAEAGRRVAGTFLSGPVGGVSGAVRVAEMAGVRNIITFDMGGTSTDVALVHDLKARMSHDNQIDAYPLQMPQLDIHAIGAGGGSIVWVGSDGTLQIGPQSAGALPGPACYGRGGEEPTISDANLLLGRLPTERPLSGGLRLDRRRAEHAFRRLGEKVGSEDIIGLADTALRIAVAKMAGAVREVSVHRGFDPREFTLLGFGGAGPMHIFNVADELGIPQLIVPKYPGHLSALGQMLADIRHDLVSVWAAVIDQVEHDELRRHAETMQCQAKQMLERDGIPAAAHRYAFSLDMRYVGQSFTLPIPWDSASKAWQPLREAFDTRHAETFGYCDPANQVEVVNIRVVATGLTDKPRLSFSPEKGGDALIERRDVWFNGWLDCSIYQRDRMGNGFELKGPAIIEEAGGTSVVPPNWRVKVHNSGALLCSNAAG